MKDTGSGLSSTSTSWNCESGGGGGGDDRFAAGGDGGDVPAVGRAGSRDVRSLPRSSPCNSICQSSPSFGHTGYPRKVISSIDNSNLL